MLKILVLKNISVKNVSVKKYYCYKIQENHVVKKYKICFVKKVSKIVSKFTVKKFKKSGLKN